MQLMNNKRTKVRFHTWYWGNYCTAPEGIELPLGFELYDETAHGWNNSEEYKTRKTEKYKHGVIERLEDVVHMEFIVNQQKKMKNEV